MPHEDTPPRTQVILLFTLMSAVTLVVLQPLFVSYFETTRAEQERAKVREVPAGGYDEYREEQHRRLRSGPMPIGKAIEELAREGREGPELVRPEPSEDPAPAEGWGFRPGEEAPPPPTPEPSR